MLPCPVAQYALDRGFPADLIFTPERAGEVIDDSALNNFYELNNQLACYLESRDKEAVCFLKLLKFLCIC